MARILSFERNVPQTRFSATYRVGLSLLSCLVFLLCFVAPAKADGPLRASADNARFFVDSNGKAVYLTGVHLNNDLVDRSDKTILDFTSYLNFLQQYQHNFVRLWAWEQAAWINESTAKITFDPLPYQRKGPGTALDGGRKFDVTRFNQTYFDRLRSRVVEAGQHGIYVSVMLFQGFSSQRKNISGGNPWTGHPFNPSNNINGINGDPSGNDNGEEVHSLTVPAITSLQEAYVRKVVDTLNDLDNVLYEISGDSPASTKDWQYYMINYLKGYEATKPKQHPVGMSYLYLGSADDLLASPADWILLPGTDTDPSLVAGSKVILSDMDPKLLGSATSYALVWKSFMRGLSPIYLESSLVNPTASEDVRTSMGYALQYSQLVNLSSMVPDSQLCSTGYCLVNPGLEYLVYLPSGGSVRVDLSAASGSFVVTWFSPLTGQTTSGDTVTGGIPILFTSPIAGDAVLYLQGMSALSQNSDTSSGLSASDTILTSAATSTTTSNLTLSNSGPVTLTQGASVITPISASSTSASSTASRKRSTVSFSVSGLPQGISAAFSPSSCTPNCLTQLTLTAASSVAVGSYTITVTGKNKQYQATTSFSLSVAQPTVAVSPPTINPNGSTFTNSTSVSLQTSTSGASIYYTTDGTTPTQSSKLYSAPFTLTATALVKAEAFKSGMTPSSVVSAWFTKDVSFDFSLSNDGNKSVTPGQATASTITATLSSGSSQAVTFSTAGLPTGATASYTTSTSCNPTCSRTLNIATAASTPTGTSTITVTAAGGGVTKTTSFTLTVNSSTRSITTNIADGAVLSGSAVLWTATPSDSPIRVDFFIDGALLWTEGIAPYQFNGDPSGTLNTTTLSNSSHQLKVRATYSDNTMAERAVNVTVSNGTTSTPAFDFSLSNSGNISVTAGSSVANTINTTLVSGSAQSITFSGSGLPTGTTASFSPASCSPTCSSTLTINTSSSTPAASSTITVTATGGGVTKTTTFSLTVNSPTTTPTVATPTISPNGGSFTGSVSVTIQTTTSGASIFYTTNGSTPTQSSTLYTGAFTLTSSATVKTIAFKSGSNPSAQASATFTVTAAPAQLTLTWQDNSTNESNFAIERKTGTSGTYSQIASVSANITSYVDAAVTSGVTYCYRVDATNSAGASAYTNEACGTVP
jgi:hypothetical protein